MLSASDILNLLERWEPWKRITSAPARIDALEKEIEQLRLRLDARPADNRPRCSACGTGAMAQITEKPDPHMGPVGGKLVTRRCESCGFQTERQEFDD